MRVISVIVSLSKMAQGRKKGGGGGGLDTDQVLASQRDGTTSEGRMENEA